MSLWLAGGAAALSIMGSVFQNKREKAIYKANRIVDRARVEAGNTLRAANNELAAAEASLQGFVQSLNSRRLLEAAGADYNAASMNMARVAEEMVAARAGESLIAAEQLGALAASAAAAGMGGSTVDMINQTSRLRSAITQQAVEKNNGQYTYDMVQQRAGILSAYADQLDFVTPAADIDYSQDVKQFFAKPRMNYAGMLLDAGRTFTTFGGSFGSSSPAPANQVEVTGQLGRNSTMYGLQGSGSKSPQGLGIRF